MESLVEGSRLTNISEPVEKGGIEIGAISHSSFPSLWDKSQSCQHQSIEKGFYEDQPNL